MSENPQELMEVLSELLEDYDDLLAIHNEYRADRHQGASEEDYSATLARAIIDKYRQVVR